MDLIYKQDHDYIRNIRERKSLRLTENTFRHPCPFRNNRQGPRPISLSRNYLKKVY